MRRLRILASLAALVLGATGLVAAAAAQEEETRPGMGMGQGMGPGMMGEGMMGQGMMGQGMMSQGMGPGMMGRRMMRGHGMMACHRMHGMGPRACMRLMELADTDSDGNISKEEASNFWTQQLGKYDADDDGKLSIKEFAAMHAAHTRPMMVDRFQFFDEDGDAVVTESELQAPFIRMLRFMDRNRDDAIGPGDMRGRMRQGLGPRQ